VERPRPLLSRLPGADATLWSLVFPLGMYAVAGIYLGRADRLPVVEAIGRGELWVAMTVCLVVMVAMLRHIVVTVLRSEPSG
jgi:tellurite resistance protein TehA-like permease